MLRHSSSEPARRMSDDLIHQMIRWARPPNTSLAIPRGCDLRQLPSEVWDLVHLERLNVGFNQLESVSPNIARLTELRYLNLAGNQLGSLPPEIGELANLEYLQLMGNQIDSVPPEIGCLRKLRCLHLSDNQLEHVPPEIGSLIPIHVSVWSFP